MDIWVGPYRNAIFPHLAGPGGILRRLQVRIFWASHSRVPPLRLDWNERADRPFLRAFGRGLVSRTVSYIGRFAAWNIWFCYCLLKSSVLLYRFHLREESNRRRSKRDFYRSIHPSIIARERERNGRPVNRSVQRPTTPSEIRSPETLRSQTQAWSFRLQIHRNRRNRTPDHWSNQIHRPQCCWSLRWELLCRIHLSAI